jgi:protein SCO1
MMAWRCVTLLAAICIAGCQRREPLPVLRTVPAFALTSQNGTPFGSDELAGKIWVADFIYTTCPGPCPRMSSQMRRIQELTSGTPQVALVSLTVNPDVDTPAVLTEYAKRYKADLSRWHFLTGKMEVLHMLKRDAFKLGDVTGTLEHSTRFVLIDRKGQVRAYYTSMDGDPVPHVVDDVRGLLEEK